jgi:hypothetical protein
MGLRDLVSTFLSLSDMGTESILRVLDNWGFWGPKDGRRFLVDVDFGLLKLVGLHGSLSCFGGIHCSRRVARSMGT